MNMTFECYHVLKNKRLHLAVMWDANTTAA